MDTHPKMAATILSIFAQGQGVQISSTIAEQMAEIKLWLAAIAEGKLVVGQPVTEGMTPPPGTEPPAIDPPEGANGS